MAGLFCPLSSWWKSENDLTQLRKLQWILPPPPHKREQHHHTHTHTGPSHTPYQNAVYIICIKTSSVRILCYQKPLYPVLPRGDVFAWAVAVWGSRCPCRFTAKEHLQIQNNVFTDEWDHNALCTQLHFAFACNFPYLDHKAGYRLHVKLWMGPYYVPSS